MGEKMTEPLITVVVPIYNVEKYLDRCLKSIASQTYRNLEIILVDDGSPDKSPQMCDEWAKKDSRIRVVHKANAGSGMARNTGIDYASGEYIFFFDSDDYIAPDTVEKCVYKAQVTLSDTVLYGRNEVYSDGSVKKIINKFPKSVYESEEIVNILLPGLYTYRFGFGVSSWSKMFSMQIIRQHNLRFWSEREVTSEDAFFCLDYFSKSLRVTLLEDNLYYYYRNEKSISRSYNPDCQRRNDEFMLKGMEKVRELVLPETVIGHFKARYQIYSLAAMKLITAADMPSSQRKSELRKIYKDKTLRGSITLDALRRDTRSVALFMLLIKMRAFYLCDLLLRMKAK